MKRDVVVRGLFLSLVVLSVGFLAACGGGSTDTASYDATEAEPGAADEQAGVEQRESELEQREADLAQREQDVAARELKAAEREQRPATSSTTKKPSSTSGSKPASQPAAAMPAAGSPAPTQLVELTVPSFTGFDVEFVDSLSSETSVVGDPFRARLVRDMLVDGQVAVPAGSEVNGEVIEVVSSKKIGGQAKLTLQFNTLRMPSGATTALKAQLGEAGKKQTAKDAATIGGATAGGAILGRVLDKGSKKDKGTVLGAIVGAAVGTAIASKNAGDPVMLDAGTVVALSLDEPVTVYVAGDERHFDRYAMNP